MKKFLVLSGIGLMCIAFRDTIHLFDDIQPVPIPASPQRSGNAEKGYQYLVTGDYLKSGIPYNYFKLAYGKANGEFIKRDGFNADISYEYTAVKASNGEIVVAPNC